MAQSTASNVAKVARRCTAGFFLASVISCGTGGDANLSPVFFAFLLFALALASLIVGVTATDVAGDDPHPGGVDTPVRPPKRTS